MGKTSTAVKKRYNDKTYKKYTVNLRYDTNKDIIDYIDAHTSANRAIVDALKAFVSAKK